MNVLDSDEGWYGGLGRASRQAFGVLREKGDKPVIYLSVGAFAREDSLIKQGMMLPPRTGVILRPHH